jgi:predicted dehydrogenase
MKKNIGIIGFGEMGKRHAGEFYESTNGFIHTKAVVEPSEKKYEEGCEWINYRPERYSSVKEMLANENLDGVIISSPNFQHLENLQEFTGLDMPILLEKPLDSEFDKILEIVRFADKYEGPIIVDHVMRYAPIIRKAKAIIDSGQLGHVCSFTFIQTIGGCMYRNFRRTMKGGGGQLLEKATHDFDVLLFLTGSNPKRVAAISKQQAYGGKESNDLHCSNCDKQITCPDRLHTTYTALKDVKPTDDLCPYAQEIDIADNEACLIELDNNIFGTYSHCYFVRGDSTREYEIIGTRGIMKISLTVKNPLGYGKIKINPRYDTDDCDTMEFLFDYKKRIHYNGGPGVAKHFYEVMDGHTKPFTTVNQAFIAEMISYSAILASETGQFIDIEKKIPEDILLKIQNI